MALNEFSLTLAPSTNASAIPAATATTTTTGIDSLSASASTASTTSTTVKFKSPLPRSYFVERTKSGQLPVYSEFRNAGSRTLTVIRKIQGNAKALRTDILETYPGTEVRVNDRNNHVILKGLVMDDVRQWLTAKGF
ncbi:hypothetical protein BX616_004198 [Lobosporangium transversale]|uniref:Large ribosomal subunit protein mL49 n=1 Tax=Lobosporangium transversale TaxID=64571 RepID=A0A1Y2GD10_9FUNG|nr:mitochondrial large subunit ribosomal protein-domain-containing protein [Lobosporangium transversale]KAF9918926.1 hypothetical protein BX616_004198 [Lobosporangium transversale]ORZ06121.1 mitochondrial large subunit ribosomal protein-domain-containing protein [Lobosporangium transversale]|eukprot:XP_021877390.1 mitochondrial large subunit ribosomal protein-domain-containing protein [Lobosporangium transversale]